MSFFDAEDEIVEQPKIVGKPKKKVDVEPDLDYRNKNVINTLWVEKYRPKTLDEYVGNEAMKNRFAQYIESGDIPHMLLHGPAGTGKTTAAKMISDSIECDILYINASDENSVDVVRDKIKGFASSAGWKQYKICILDEADYITINGQAALRNVMETYSLHTRFILTCNSFERIHPAIVSRSQVERIVPPSKKDIAIHAKNILVSENVKYEPSDIGFIVNSYYPDVRKIIGSLQQFSRNGTLTIDAEKIIDGDVKLKIFETLKSGDKKTAYKEIRQLLADNNVSNFDEIYKYIYDNIDNLAPKASAQCILILAEMQYKSSMVPDKEINFMASIIQLIEVLKS
jgi:DNA polymerase III delta prime subunit